MFILKKLLEEYLKVMLYVAIFFPAIMLIFIIIFVVIFYPLVTFYNGYSTVEYGFNKEFIMFIADIVARIMLSGFFLILYIFVLLTISFIFLWQAAKYFLLVKLSFKIFRNKFSQTVKRGFKKIIVGKRLVCSEILNDNLLLLMDIVRDDFHFSANKNIEFMAFDEDYIYIFMFLDRIGSEELCVVKIKENFIRNNFFMIFNNFNPQVLKNKVRITYNKYSANILDSVKVTSNIKYTNKDINIYFVNEEGIQDVYLSFFKSDSSNLSSRMIEIVKHKAVEARNICNNQLTSEYEYESEKI